jgi:hypothetical protein
VRQRILPFLWVLQSLSRGQRCAPPVSVLVLAAGLCAGLSRGLPVLVQMWQQGAPLWLDSGLCDVAVGRAGTTTRNIGMTIITYGMVWVLWLIVNRFLCEYITMVDGYLTFAQIAGESLSVRSVPAMRQSNAVWHFPATLQASSASSMWNGQVRSFCLRYVPLVVFTTFSAVVHVPKRDRLQRRHRLVE